MNHTLQSKNGLTKPNRTRLGNGFELIGMGDKFLNITQCLSLLRSLTDRKEFIKLKSFYKENDIFNGTKWQQTGETIFTIPTFQ